MTLRNSKIILLALFMVLGHLGVAQEQLFPLGSNPLQHQNTLRSGSGTFVYTIDTLHLPFIDDFSVDRLLHPACVGAANVTSTTYYKLYVDGSPVDSVVLTRDTTFTFTYDDGSGDNDGTLYRIPHTDFTVECFDINGADPTALSSTFQGWPPYDIYDTTSGPADTTFYLFPEVIYQDSIVINTVSTNGLLWQDNHAFVNATFPIDPPTVGVATFDGLDSTGYPYNFVDEDAQGPADYLTSFPINMFEDVLNNPYSLADSLYLSFFYQPRGRGKEPEERDSLALEFWAPLDAEWNWMWSTTGKDLAAFEQVMIPIVDNKYLQNGFKFRFRNYATLSGSTDHWHIDYVRLDENRAYNDTIIDDLAFVYEVNTLLETYTAVPFRHYEANPTSFMRDTIATYQKNLSSAAKLVSNEFNVRLQDGGFNTTFVDVGNPTIQPHTSFNTEHEILAVPNTFVYDTALADTCMIFEVLFAHNTTPDENRDNDTIRFLQKFTNYYAYDDGTAELAYGIWTTGAQIAQQFNANITDTLRGVWIYFSPSIVDVSDESFLLTIWGDDNGEPGGVITQNVTFSRPTYGTALNRFIYYPLDSPVLVSGRFYVGMLQTGISPARLNIGFDRNTNNQSRIFHNATGVWTNTIFQGSLMMRPVFTYNKDYLISVEEDDLPELQVSIYPNPTQYQFNIELMERGNTMVELFDMSGKLVHSSTMNAFRSTLDVSGYNNGIYLLKLTDLESQRFATQRVVVQK